MKKLYFVRHGQTEWNAIRRMQGQWNSDLSKLGREHAAINGALLKKMELEHLFVSPLDRTRQTAEIINAHLNLPMTFDERIMEWDCGDWSGHLYSEVEEKWPHEWTALRADPFNYRGPNCENYPDMFERVRPFVDEVLATSLNRIGIVSHGMIGKVMIAAVLGLDDATTLEIHQPNDVVLVVELAGEGARVHHYVAGDGPIDGLHGRD